MVKMWEFAKQHWIITALCGIGVAVCIGLLLTDYKVYASWVLFLIVVCLLIYMHYDSRRLANIKNRSDQLLVLIDDCVELINKYIDKEDDYKKWELNYYEWVRKTEYWIETNISKRESLFFQYNRIGFKNKQTQIHNDKHKELLENLAEMKWNIADIKQRYDDHHKLSEYV